MATTETRETILRVLVDNNKAIAQIAEWNQLIDEQKAKQAELSQARRDGTISEGDYQKAMAASRNEVAAYSKQVQSLTKEVQNNVTQTNASSDSLASLRAQLSNATKEFDNLSAAEREGAKGQELAKHINTITTQLKTAEEGTQRYYRNVGNYKKGVVEAFTSMGGATGSMIGPLKNATLGLKTMSQTPVIAIMGLLANIIAKVIEKLKSSEDNMTAMTSAFGIFNGVGTMVNKILQSLGKGLAAVSGWLSKVADKLGLVSEEMKAEQQLTRDEMELHKKERENRMKNADDELEIAKLKAQAAEKLKYSAQERIAFLEEAAKKEEAISHRNLEAAAEEYRILQERSKLSDNSAEDNDKLAEAYEKMRQAETNFFNKQKELNAQLVEAKNQILSTTKAQASADNSAADAAAKRTQAEDKAAQERLKQQMSIQQREISERLKLVQDGTLQELDLRKRLMQAQWEMEDADLARQEGTDELRKLKRESFLKEMEEMELSYYDKITAGMEAETEALIDAWQAEADAEKKTAEDRKKAQRSAASAIAGALGALADATGELGAENEEMTKLSKVLALAQIAINTGVATAEGIKNAMKVAFPANIAAIATVIATVVSGMASAVATVKSAQFASGGLVVGPGSATSDSIPARLSNGESVMNARTTSMFAPILSALNTMGGGVPFQAAGGQEGLEYMATAVAAGMQAADIYVSVESIDRVGASGNRVRAMATR